MMADDDAPGDSALLSEQIDYYRARAPEYEDWWFRRGRYDHGPQHAADWFAEVREVERSLDALLPADHILELACGPGYWTERLAAAAGQLTAVDAAPEVVALNRQRNLGDHVQYVEADIFEWAPDRAYDLVFFGFWISHVPADRFETFWHMVGRALKPGGTAFFLDNMPDQGGGLPGQPIWKPEEPLADAPHSVERTLADGRQFRIVKIYYEPEELSERLGQLGWRGEVNSTGRFFIRGTVRR